MGFKLTILVLIGTDCTGKSNYHTIMTTTAPEIVIFSYAPNVYSNSDCIISEIESNSKIRKCNKYFFQLK